MTTKLGKSRTKAIIDADYCCQMAITFSHTQEHDPSMSEMGYLKGAANVRSILTIVIGTRLWKMVALLRTEPKE